jgi:hypothetical protein
MVQVASYLKLPHPHIIDGDNWLDRRLVVGWRWGQRHLTHNLPREKLGKTCTPHTKNEPYGHCRPTAAMVPRASLTLPSAEAYNNHPTCYGVSLHC